MIMMEDSDKSRISSGDNPGHVSRAFCDERHRGLEKFMDLKFEKVMGKLKAIDKKVDGIQGERKEEKRDWWDIGKKIIVGVALIVFTYVLTTWG